MGGTYSGRVARIGQAEAAGGWMERVGGQVGRCVRGMRMDVVGWNGGAAWRGSGWERDVGGPGGQGTSMKGMMQQAVRINTSVGHGGHRDVMEAQVVGRVGVGEFRWHRAPAVS